MSENLVQLERVFKFQINYVKFLFHFKAYWCYLNLPTLSLTLVCKFNECNGFIKKYTVSTLRIDGSFKCVLLFIKISLENYHLILYEFFIPIFFSRFE